MTAEGAALAAIVVLLFPMGYFLLASPAFLLVRLDVPQVAQLLRGIFSIHFAAVSVAGVIGTVAFAIAGHPLLAIGVGVIAALAFWERGWFLRRWDAQLDAEGAADTAAARRLRRLHWSGMASNAIQLAAVVACIPYIAVAPS